VAREEDFSWEGGLSPAFRFPGEERFFIPLTASFGFLPLKITSMKTVFQISERPRIRKKEKKIKKKEKRRKRKKNKKTKQNKTNKKQKKKRKRNLGSAIRCPQGQRRTALRIFGSIVTRDHTGCRLPLFRTSFCPRSGHHSSTEPFLPQIECSGTCVALLLKLTLAHSHEGFLSMSGREEKRREERREGHRKGEAMKLN